MLHDSLQLPVLSNKGKNLAQGGQITPDHIIVDIMKIYRYTEKVFRIKRAQTASHILSRRMKQSGKLLSYNVVENIIMLELNTAAGLRL